MVHISLSIRQIIAQKLKLEEGAVPKGVYISDLLSEDQTREAFLSAGFKTYNSTIHTKTPEELVWIFGDNAIDAFAHHYPGLPIPSYVHVRKVTKLNFTKCKHTGPATYYAVDKELNIYPLVTSTKNYESEREMRNYRTIPLIGKNKELYSKLLNGELKRS